MSSRRVNPQNPLPTGKALRGLLLAQGLTVEGFARQSGFSTGTVRAVVAGRRGKRGRGKSAEITNALRSALSL